LSLGDPGLFDDLADAIADSGADPGHIVIELTETAFMQDEVMAAAFVERAEALGCEFALDDFGTVFGGFSYLKSLSSCATCGRASPAAMSSRPSSVSLARSATGRWLRAWRTT
jgi:predicted signal transduction protein with EAL and GGDEF domain